MWQAQVVKLFCLIIPFGVFGQKSKCYYFDTSECLFVTGTCGPNVVYVENGNAENDGFKEKDNYKVATFNNFADTVRDLKMEFRNLISLDIEAQGSLNLQKTSIHSHDSLKSISLMADSIKGFKLFSKVHKYYRFDVRTNHFTPEIVELSKMSIYNLHIDFFEENFSNKMLLLINEHACRFTLNCKKSYLIDSTANFNNLAHFSGNLVFSEDNFKVLISSQLVEIEFTDVKIREVPKNVKLIKGKTIVLSDCNISKKAYKELSTLPYVQLENCQVGNKKGVWKAASSSRKLNK